MHAYRRFPFLVAFFLPPFLAFLLFAMVGFTPLVGWLVPHRFATKVGGLLPPPALVVVEIRV